jgi:hypothetical protein
MSGNGRSRSGDVKWFCLQEAHLLPPSSALMKEVACSPETLVKSSWNVIAHGDARKGKWRGKWRMEWVASTLHTTSEHGVSSITTADAHTSAASSRLNWRPRRFKWTRPFRRKTKSGFCACAITFQLASTYSVLSIIGVNVGRGCADKLEIRTIQNVYFIQPRTNNKSLVTYLLCTQYMNSLGVNAHCKRKQSVTLVCIETVLAFSPYSRYFPLSS